MSITAIPNGTMILFHVVGGAVSVFVMWRLRKIRRVGNLRATSYLLSRMVCRWAFAYAFWNAMMIYLVQEFPINFSGGGYVLWPALCVLFTTWLLFSYWVVKDDFVHSQQNKEEPLT